VSFLSEQFVSYLTFSLLTRWSASWKLLGSGFAGNLCWNFL